MARKDDRRILRTRKLLRESLLQLILEDGYDNISIQDVTDKADLGRATFYLHYREKDDLLTDLLQQQLEDFFTSNPAFTGGLSQAEDLKFVQKLFEFAESHYDLYRIILMGGGSMVGMLAVRDVFRGVFQNALNGVVSATGRNVSVERDFLENYHTGALISLVFWWMNNDMPYTPAQMAEMYLQVNEFESRSFALQPQPEDNQAEALVKSGKPDKKQRSVSQKPNKANVRQAPADLPVT